VLSSFFALESVANHATLQQYKNSYPDMVGAISIIREPRERFRSAVQFLVNRNFNISCDDLHDSLQKIKYNKKPSLSDLFLFPQYSFLVSDVPTRLYSIKNINLLLSHLGIDEPPNVTNVSRPSAHADALINSFEEKYIDSFYSIDLALYNDIMLSDDGFLEVKNPKKYFYSTR
jgi:hypothetical protein